MVKSHYTISCCAFPQYPVKILKGNAFCGKYQRDVYYDLADTWGGRPHTVIIEVSERPLPDKIKLTWLSVMEQECYSLNANLDILKAEKMWKERNVAAYDETFIFTHVICGLMPEGNVAVWLYSMNKIELLQVLSASKIQLPSSQLSPTAIKEIYDMTLAEDEHLRSIAESGIKPYLHYKNWIAQFNYRYIGLEEYFDGEKWQLYDEDDLFFDDLDFDSIKNQRFDGTLDQLQDGALMNYHKAGCPKLLALKWHEGRNDLSAYYWFDEQMAPQSFYSLLMMNADGRSDVLLRIDTRANQYEIAIKGEYLVEPIAFPKESYQLLVFMNGNELYRSENFVQEDGAWEW